MVGAWTLKTLLGAHLLGAHVLGALAGSTPLQLTIALQPRDPAALAAYAAAVSDPSSPDYHRYLSVASFAARFGAAPATVTGVSDSLRARGLSPEPPSANGLSISVRGSASQVSRALSTSFERVSVAGRIAYVNTVTPTLASAAGVQAILGLNDLASPAPLGVSGRSAAVAAGAPPAPHLGPGGGVTPCTTAATAAAAHPTTYTADQIASAYAFGGLYAAGDLGAGETIGVYELEGSFPSDITAYQACYGITPTTTTANVTYQIVKTGPPAPVASQRDGLETALDVENIIGLAPQANVIVYQGPNSGSGPYDTYRAMISATPHVQVIASSWGECESALGTQAAQAESTLFQEAAVQGQTVLASSGDNGSEDCYDPSTPSVGRTAAVDDPASQPFVTGVGGTSLPAAAPGGETVWNTRGSGASGGGDSMLWPMPAYQSSAAPSLGVINSASSTTSCGASTGYCRQVPDVSADADPQTGYLVYYNGNGDYHDTSAWHGEGGTSASAPVWAALIALADGSAQCAGSPIGFANPVLYGAAGTSSYASFFNDVTSGGNDWLSATAGLFTAKAGYDQATGLGTPVGSALAGALCAGPVTLRSPGAQSTIVGTAASLQLQASAASGTPGFTATGLPPGLSIDPVSGLISGSPTSTGVYPVAVAAMTSGQSAFAQFTWSVATATVALDPVATQHGALGRPASLQLSAGDNNGAPIRFSATGLPAGLVLNQVSGLVSGVPKSAGTVLVALTASAPGAAPAVSSFQWIVAGPPRVVQASLAGVGADQPSLRLTVAAGIDAPALTRVVLSLPRGLSLASSRRSVSGAVSLSGHLPFRISTAGGRLSLTLGIESTALTVKIGPKALVVSRSLRRLLDGSHAPRRLSGSVRLLDADGASTVVPLSFRS
ncbi:MAG: protease pro-enzyme activation domain-containing protein [Solirubrobacteraceae bacterium]